MTTDKWTDLDAIPGIRASVMSMTSPNGHLGFMFTPTDTVVPYKLNDLRKGLIEAFSKGDTLRQIFETLADPVPDRTRQEILDELDFLLEQRILEPDKRKYGHPATDRWDRQLNFFGIWSPDGRAGAEAFQKKLSQAKVTVIGIGGFGTHILTGLAHMGVGHVTAVDPDQVQASNLNRQILFTEADVGKLKTEGALRRCQAIYPEQDLKTICRRIKGEADLADLIRERDLVVFTADTPRLQIFSWMNTAAHKARVPVLFTLGMTPEAVLAGPLVIPGTTPCLSCSLPQLDLRPDTEPAAGLNKGYFHGTAEPYLMAGAGILLNEILNVLTGIRPCGLAGARLALDMATYATARMPAQSRPDCPVCGKPV